MTRSFGSSLRIAGWVLLTTLNGSDLTATEATDLLPASTRTAGQDLDATPTSIQWRDLAPQNGRPFVDPFSKLSDDQIVDLSFVFRVRRLVAEDKLDASGRDAQEAASLADRLAGQGLDIGWLMVQRKRIEQLRELQVAEQATAIAESIGEQRFELTGYAIPIRMEETRLVEFLLVPTTAACSHENPPPRLQVVRVIAKQGIANPGRRKSVRVSGKIIAETTSHRIVNANGRISVDSAYTMLEPVISLKETHEWQPD